jgi:hypothetical protein
MISQKPTPLGMSILLITPFLCVRLIEIYEVSSVRTIAECYLINILKMYGRGMPRLYGDNCLFYSIIILFLYYIPVLVHWLFG